MSRTEADQRPRAVRARFRAGEAVPTAGLAPGHTQANLISVPADWAYDMLLFCQRNPKPCPVLGPVRRVFAGPRRSPSYRW
ncbi:hypothetical protein QIS99_32010, partial [Streptomyces sp. B-S-A8]|nr:hypothetical protein [Streptomyces sp. B-S-A8]